MILSISDWQEVSINDRNLGGGSAGIQLYTREVLTPAVSPNPGDDHWFPNHKSLSAGNHLLHTYLGEVAENNNGSYLQVADIVTQPNRATDGWKPFMEGENFYPNLMIARNLAAGGAQVPWKDKETGVLTAKQACADLRDGGYKDWRLPRVSELYLFARKNMPIEFGENSDHIWSATEYDADNCYASRYYHEFTVKYIYPEKNSKYATFYVRCVRDKDKPKPTI